MIYYKCSYDDIITTFIIYSNESKLNNDINPNQGSEQKGRKISINDLKESDLVSFESFRKEKVKSLIKN